MSVNRPEMTSRLFGESPDVPSLPFCALSPTVTASTMAVAHVMRHSPEATPEAVARELSSAWESYLAGGIAHPEICGVRISLFDLQKRGSIWTHEPIEASTYDEAHARAAARPEPASEPLAEVGVAPEPSLEHPAQEGAQRGGAQRDAARPRWPHLKFPNAFVHPYTRQGAKGTYQKGILTVPHNTKVFGVDVGGFSLDAFLSSRAMDAKTLGKPVVISLDPDKPVKLFKGKGDSQQTRLVRPWDLTVAMASSARAFEASRNARGRDRGEGERGHAAPGRGSGKEDAHEEGEGNEPLASQAASARAAAGIDAPSPSRASQLEAGQ